MFGLVLLSASASTSDVVTMNFEANIHPPFTTLPHPVGPSASSANSTDQIHALHYNRLHQITVQLAVTGRQWQGKLYSSVNCMCTFVCLWGEEDVKEKCTCIRTTDIDSGISIDVLSMGWLYIYVLCGSCLVLNLLAYSHSGKCQTLRKMYLFIRV